MNYRKKKNVALVLLQIVSWPPVDLNPISVEKSVVFSEEVTESILNVLVYISSGSIPISSRKIPIGVLFSPMPSILLTILFLMFRSRIEAWTKIAAKYRQISIIVIDDYQPVLTNEWEQYPEHENHDRSEKIRHEISAR